MLALRDGPRHVPRGRPGNNSHLASAGMRRAKSLGLVLRARPAALALRTPPFIVKNDAAVWETQDIPDFGREAFALLCAGLLANVPQHVSGTW